MIVDELKKSILENAIRGRLTVQNSNERATNFLNKLIEGKKEYISNNKLQDNMKKEKIKEYPFELPNNWIWTTIGDICYVTKLAGFEYTKYMASNVSTSGDVPIVRAKNIKPASFIDTIEEYISLELSEKLYRCALNEKCVLMTFIGAGIGEVTIFDKNERYHLAPNVAKIVPPIDINKYIMYYLMSPTGLNEVFKYKKQTAQPSLSMETIRKVVIPLPPIEEQQRIIDKIEELFSKLDEIKPIEGELNTIKRNFPNNMKKSILKDAFDGKYSILPFNEWTNDKLINACDEICTGNSISENVKKTKYTNLKDGYNYIGTKDLKFDHSFEYETGVKIPFEEMNFKYANVNDILLCIEGGSAGKKIGILDKKVCYGNKLCKFSSSKLNSKFLYYYLQSPQFIKNFYDNISGIIGGVSISKIKTINVSFPPVEEQQRIVDKLEELLPLCDDIEKLVAES